VLEHKRLIRRLLVCLFLDGRCLANHLLAVQVLRGEMGWDGV
jgi:hypothetical protein